MAGITDLSLPLNVGGSGEGGVARGGRAGKGAKGSKTLRLIMETLFSNFLPRLPARGA